ncbi:MAG: hypothetical protein RBQ97_06585 [Acholeplasma sp.]|nr:hypothetical protein [Acholeplasma sp.]
MKKRIIILLTTFLFMFITLFVSFFIIDREFRRIILALSLIFFTYSSIYFIGGIGKLVSSIIYGIGLGILLSLLPKYDNALFFIGTFLFALNPLSDFEQVVEERFPTDRSIISQLKGSYEPYYEYRKEIKNYYHLPQMRKIYTKPRYLKLRRAVTIVMAMLAVFLLIREVNNLINLLKHFDIHTFFASTYSVIILSFLTVILYHKGFQSTLNLLTVSIFPPISYSLFLVVKPTYLGIILGLVILVLGIIIGLYQYFSFRSRIVYEYYFYYDNEKQAEVYANALYEPFVYNEDFNQTVIFKIKTNIQFFNKIFHSIVVYADLHRFYITAYTYNRNEIVLYTEFHHQENKTITKFKNYLETVFEGSIKSDLIIEKGKKFYEENFFHNNDYIVARTVYLAEILKKLEIKSNVIISMVAYFNDLKDINELSNKNYTVVRLPEYDMKNVFTARIDMKVANVEYIIDSKVRELLLDLLINHGTYVRISVYY